MTEQVVAFVGLVTCSRDACITIGRLVKSSGTWHIASMSKTAKLTLHEVHKLSGTPVRTIQRHAAQGRFPDAYRHDGCHWTFQNNAALQVWIKEQARSRQRRATPNAKINGSLGRGTGFVSIEGLRGGFDIWHRRMALEIPNWNANQLRRAIELLSPLAEEVKNWRERLEKKRPLIYRDQNPQE